VQYWQVLVPVIFVAVIVAAVVANVRSRGAATSEGGDFFAGLRAQCAAQRRSGESEPVCVMAVRRRMFSGSAFYLGLTNQRLFVSQGGGPAQPFPLEGVSVDVCQRTWRDTGNMTITISSGWEVRLSAPGQKYVWRVYELGTPEQLAEVRAFLGALVSVG